MWTDIKLRNVLWLIVKQLNRKELFNSRLVCSTWNRFLVDKIKNTTKCVKNEEDLKMNCGWKELNIGTNIDENTVFDSNVNCLILRNSLIKYPLKLKFLGIYGKITDLSSVPISLTTLTLSSIEHTLPLESLNILKNLNQLKRLGIVVRGNPKEHNLEIEGLEKLMSVSLLGFDYPKFPRNVQIIKLCGKCGDLTHLKDLEKVTLITDDFDICKLPTTLKFLSLSVKNISNLHYLENFSRLEKLIISKYTSRYTEDKLPFIPRLKYLKGCFVTKHVFPKMKTLVTHTKYNLESFPNLEQISGKLENFYASKQIKYLTVTINRGEVAHLSELLEKFPNIIKLSVLGSGKIYFNLSEYIGDVKIKSLWRLNKILPDLLENIKYFTNLETMTISRENKQYEFPSHIKVKYRMEMEM